MDSQLSKIKGITEEEFRSCYPDVSIQHLSEKSAIKITPSVEKRLVVKSPVKSAAMPKATTVVAKTPVKMPSVKTPQSVGVKASVAVTKANVPASPKTPVTTTKPPIVTKTPVVAKMAVPNKAPVPTPPVTKNSPSTTVKTVAKPQSTLLKTTPLKQQVTSPKAAQNLVKPQAANVVKAPVKSVTTTPVVGKEDSPDQSTMTVLTYRRPPAVQRSSNQLTIEKIDQQQRIPGFLDTNNQVVLQQVINNGQLVVQNRVTPAETTVQSVVIGSTAQTVTPVEITNSSEPLQALQVTQQVTLFRPKGNTFTVDDVKKQIGLNKQSTMTNVVSSTTNSIPSPAVQPQPEQKKPVVAARAQGAAQSPVRQSNRVNPQIRAQQRSASARSNYQSTRGQVKKVSPKCEIPVQKRDIPMQKVSPMQPPPLPPPELQLGNEEEVTTSENRPPEFGTGTKVIVILPSGEKKEVTITEQLSLDSTIQDLLKRMNVPIPENMRHQLTAEISGPEFEESFQEDMENNEAQWESSEGPEPGEILGLGDEMEHGDSEAQLSKDEESHNSADVKSRKTKADSLTGDSPKKKRICRKKRPEEPVCLTISDDEELLGLAHHHNSQLAEENFHSTDSNSQLSSCDKEPVITDEMVAEMKHSVSGGGIDMEELLDDPNAQRQTFLQCRTVRIGSYKVVPRDKVLITPHGLKVTVPVLNSDQFVELKIMYPEIIKVLIHFGRQMPVLFFYTRPSAAAKIRKALKMDDKNGFYYDTTSSDETHRRITLLPDKIDEDCKQTLKTIFGNPENNVFAELTGKEANDILVKASPKEVQAFILKKQPNNQQQQQQQQQAQPFNGQNIQTIMIYPPPPEKGGIPINTEDYACLGEDQFLNDVIIDFYLKYVVEKTLSPEDRARTHVFSSFFYKRLTTKPPTKRKSMNPIENDPTATPAVKRHSRVKSWTKNVNLFTKDFIVIPINENSHWFLAIICFPGLTGPVRFSDNTPIDLPGRKKKNSDDNKAAVGVLSGKHTVTIGSTTITAVAPSVNMSTTQDLNDDLEDRDEADGEDEDMDVPDSDELLKKIKRLSMLSKDLYIRLGLDSSNFSNWHVEHEDAMQRAALPEVKEEPEDEPQMVTRKSQREPIKQPCILIFDSLAGASRSRVVATLRDYLRVEYEAKHGESRDFSGEVMKGTNLRCPQQTNYTDCGLYVLQYVEAFFLWPVTDYRIPIKQLQDWFQADIVSRKRYEIQQLLHRLMQEQGIDIEALNLPLLNLRPEGKHLVEYSGTEEEEDEEEEDEEPMCEEEEEDMLDDDGEYHEDMEHENDEMEEGEIVHHNDEDPDSYIDPSMEHEDHEDHDLDEEEEDGEYALEDDNEEDDVQDEEMEKELDDISLMPMVTVKRKDLRNIRIPRLNTKNSMNDDV